MTVSDALRSGRERAVPLYRQLQSFLKRNQGFVAEQTPRERNISLRLAHISRLRSRVLRSGPLSEDLAQKGDRLIDGRAAAGAHVDCLAARVGSFTGTQGGVHDVGHVGKVARLFAVPED